MDAKQFLAEFGHIANAPSGVQRLRELVLQFAFTGELSTQRPDDLALELIESGSLSSNEGLFSIPDNWLWANFDLLTEYIQYGVTAKAVQRIDGVRFLRITDIQGDKVNWKSVPSCDFPEEKQAKFLLKNGDILIARTGGTIGKSYLVEDLDVLSVFASYLIRLTPLPVVDCRYLKLFTLSPSYWHQLSEATAGTGLPNVSASSLKRLEIPLPPLEEQSRIVAKVDELMALCDKLEVQQQNKRELQNKLRQSVLQAVANAESPKELQDSWERLAGNFSHLFAEAEDVEELKSLIRDMAAHGLLSFSHDGDSLIGLLLEDVINVRNETLTPREKKEIQLLSDEAFIENNRVKLTLGNISKIISGQHLKPEEYNTNSLGIPYITGPAEFKDGFPNPDKWTEEKRAVAEFGDILITVKGSGVGKTAVCNFPELAISRQLMAIRPLGSVSREYVSICIDAARKNFQEQKLGIAIPGIGRNEVMSLELILPSIEEQERIVARFKELIRFCDTFEKKLRSARKTAERLATAAIASLTGISTPQQEEPMKVPKTELKAPVRLGTTQPPSNMQAPLASLLARHNGEMGANDLWQRFGGEVDAFYAQLKTEVIHGWIAEPTGAQMLEREAD